jgi:alanine racemase
MHRVTVARVSAAALRHNAARVRELAPRARIMACVKGNGYGHGLAETAGVLAGDVDGFAVATMDEGLALRAAGVTGPVLLLEGPCGADDVGEAAAHDFLLCLHAAHQLDWLERQPAARRPSCWLKIDTGMHRLGFAPELAEQAYRRLAALAAGTAPVLCTHFAAANDTSDPATAEQLQCFDRATAGLGGTHSCANSAAICAHPASHRDWVRPGYMLYGGSPLDSRDFRALDLRPAMEFSAEIIAIRTVAAGECVGYGGRWCAARASRIATVAAGYGDGYPRHAPDGTPVRIGARRSPLAGRVSMDMITVDVTDNPEAEVGARAVLWGHDPGVDEIARAAGTIGYELLAGLPARVARQLEA